MNEQRDRSLTVMIPRAKYRSAPQQATTPQNYKTMSTFAVDEHKLIDYLEGGAHPSEIGINNSKQIQNTDYHKESEHKNLNKQQHSNFLNSGALVSAGFQVQYFEKNYSITRCFDEFFKMCDLLYYFC